MTDLFRRGLTKRLDKCPGHHKDEQYSDDARDGPPQISSTYIDIGSITRVSFGPTFAHILNSKIQLHNDPPILTTKDPLKLLNGLYKDYSFNRPIGSEYSVPTNGEHIGVGADNGEEGGQHNPILYCSLIVKFTNICLCETPSEPSKSWEA